MIVCKVSFKERCHLRTFYFAYSLEINKILYTFKFWNQKNLWRRKSLFVPKSISLSRCYAWQETLKYVANSVEIPPNYVPTATHRQICSTCSTWNANENILRLPFRRAAMTKNIFYIEEVATLNSLRGLVRRSACRDLRRWWKYDTICTVSTFY